MTDGPYQSVNEAEWAARHHYPHRVAVARPEGVGPPPILAGMVRRDIAPYPMLLHLQKVNAWCAERYGVNGIRREEVMEDGPVSRFIVYADARWCSFIEYYYFKDKDDAFEFKIRWG